MASYGGYVGKIARVDVGSGQVITLDTFDYVPEYIGGLGMAYRLLWNEINEKTTEFSAENPVIFATGPCAGTGVPTAARTEVVGLAPQSYPVPWASPSGFGGDFGPKLKYAGYDAIIITGKAKAPVYVYVAEDGIKVLDAKDCWGLNTYPTQDYFVKQHGNAIAAAVIGPAGEKKCRWAAIIARSENGAGQGGFGAVLGDKMVKGVVVQPGTVHVPVAKPDELIKVINLLDQHMSPAGQATTPLYQDRGAYSSRRVSCSWGGCTGGIAGCLPTYYSKVPEPNGGSSTISGISYCASGVPTAIMAKNDFPVTFEIARLEENLGLNHWESQLGMDFWIKNEFKRGRLKKLMGEDIPADKDGNPVLSPQFVLKWWKAVAKREGEGDVWAEGTPRAAKTLGLDDEVWKTHKHGYGPHWDGRYLQFVHSPVWIVSALGWAIDGRDPFNHQHGYLERYPSFVREWQGTKKSGWGTTTIPFQEICKLGAEIYGAENANSGWDNPDLVYTDKEYVGRWHEYRAIIKDSVPMCDRQFPLLYDTVSVPAKVGVIDAEVQAFNAVVGTDWTLEEMHQHCEKVRDLHRALHVRQGRTREHDESVIPYFEKQPDAWPDEAPPSNLEPDKFRALLDRYYALHGWDKQTGRPTKAKLEEVGLKDVAAELEKLGKL